jgi:hypothetical protein
MAFVTTRLAHLPREAFAAPMDFSKYGALTVTCAIACISATAGVFEEAGFRGFLISPIQRRHGWVGFSRWDRPPVHNLGRCNGDMFCCVRACPKDVGEREVKRRT